MNTKELFFFLLRNEWTNAGEADRTDKTDLAKCTHLYDEKKKEKKKKKKKEREKNNNKQTKETMKHKRFRPQIVFVRCKKIHR